jgi:hypothetical protein
MNSHHLPYSSFYVPQFKDLVPDSLYMICDEDTQACDSVCSNVVWSPVVDGYVHDSQTGKVFCPFGKGDSMNQHIFNDQETIVYPRTTWGMAPQMDPRSLCKIGLSWRTS